MAAPHNFLPQIGTGPACFAIAAKMGRGGGCALATLAATASAAHIRAAGAGRAIAAVER
jgi:hypothetical protein